MSRAARGRGANRSGAAAEEIAARHYTAQGGKVLARNWRAPEREITGEIDLVVLIGRILVFVEVKQRRSRAHLHGAVSEAQWRRLEHAANRYMVAEAAMTGTILGARFDLVLVGPDGVPEVIKNARETNDL